MQKHIKEKPIEETSVTQLRNYQITTGDLLTS